MIAKKCGRCGKTAFASESMAKRQARWVERKGKELRAYWSSQCHCWHLTSELEVRDRFR